ncbi:MAG TPA: hypothetical protein VFA09_06035 [Ktedonobacteraceae bacterium]|nr:hypothetical protein [Ktedonobacteraceae bacterium]
MPLQAWGNYKLRHDARFHPASSPNRVKPLIESSSEAPSPAANNRHRTIRRLSAIPGRLLLFIITGGYMLVCA